MARTDAIPGPALSGQHLLVLALGGGAAFALGCWAGAWLSSPRQGQEGPDACEASWGSGDSDDLDSYLPSSSAEIEEEEPRNHKLVLLVRQDLKMGKGKVAAQCSHATLGAYKRLLQRRDPALRSWERWGQTKVALRVDTLDELLEVQKTAQTRGLPTHVVIDQGRTQIAPNSKTVLAIGPADSDAIDEVSGHLKLL